MEKAQIDRLMVLLEYWIKHNEEHGEEFREWAEKTGDYGESAVRNDLLGAYEAMGKANELLARALDSLQKRV